MLIILVLSSGKTSEYTEVSDADMAKCGSAYCPAQLVSSANITEILEVSSNITAISEDVENENFKTDITKIYIIAGIYLACSISAALIIAFFVDPLTRYCNHIKLLLKMTINFRFGEDERNEGKEKLSGKQLLVATFRHMKKKNQILIIPLTFWSGIEQGFFGADFTAVS